MSASITGNPASGYRVKFERIGRNHNIPDLSVSGNAKRIAEQVYDYAKPKVGSRDVEVAVDLDTLTGTIFCGMRNGGTFTLEPTS